MTAELESEERAVAAKPEWIPPLKDFTTFVPILATALAIFYDVGYFHGFDINYFSFFTLNEHIVFALQALPYAMLVCAISLPQGLWLFQSKAYEGPRLPLNPTNPIYRKIVRWTVIALSVSPVIFAVYVHPQQYVLNVFALFLGMGGVLYFLGMSRVVISIVAGAALPLLAYAFGLQQATEAQDATASHIVRMEKGENREGGLLRAGERGLLFFDAATRQVTMIRWDGVTEVVTKKSLSTVGKP
jgi:hypothetical protein